MNYPNDANGDALRRMEANGDDLSRPRSIEFTVVFPDENAAKHFENQIVGLGYTASIEFTQIAQEFPWDVIVANQMIPLYEEIVAFEDFLQEAAKRLGGHTDGWGCFSERPSSVPTRLQP